MRGEAECDTTAGVQQTRSATIAHVGPRCARHVETIDIVGCHHPMVGGVYSTTRRKWEMMFTQGRIEDVRRGLQLETVKSNLRAHSTAMGSNVLNGSRLRVGIDHIRGARTPRRIGITRGMDAVGVRCSAMVSKKGDDDEW